MFPSGKTLLSFHCFILLSCISLLLDQTAAEGADYDLYGDTDYDANDPQYGLNQQHVNGNPTTVVYQPRPHPPTSRPQHDANLLLLPRFGWIRGKVGHKNINNRPINSWLGIKYGNVGRGIARFQAATPYVHYGSGPYDATQEAANCPQFPDLDEVTTKEAQGIHIDNCLTLNVHSPTQIGLYPVVVFVHGEMLFDGSAQEGNPDYFLEEDVVLVSINYRLAPFGFLTTLTDNMPGNVALDDIKIALEWIQQYIRFFNGNPDQVTLLGQAGGATLVHALSISGKAQGLFHRIILQSGTALNPYFIDEDPISTVRSFARLARCPGDVSDMEAINGCFERMSTTELLNLFKNHWEENESKGLYYSGGFKLVIGDRLGYLPVHPAGLVSNNMVPIIAGVAKDAGAFIMSRFYNQLQVRHRNITDFINIVLKHTTQPRNFAHWTNIALRHIFTQEDIRSPYLPTLAQGLLELTNLILYRAPVLDSIRYTAKSYPTYLYIFGYRGQFHRFGHLDNPLPFEADATLSDDNIYLFPYPEEVSHLSRADKSLSKKMVSMLTNFAHDSNPNRHPSVWPNVTTEVGPLLRFTNSNSNLFEVDVHFAEGIPPPNLYPEYFTTTTTTTTTRRPMYPTNSRYQNMYQPYQPANRPPYPNYRPYETVLNSPDIH